MCPPVPSRERIYTKNGIWVEVANVIICDILAIDYEVDSVGGGSKIGVSIDKACRR